MPATQTRRDPSRAVFRKKRKAETKHGNSDQITALVSEVFVCQQSRDIQQEQLTLDNAAAVREGAILVHAQPMLRDGASLGYEPLSACIWTRISYVLAGLMPIFWFGVIKGVWGSVKVIVHVS